MLVVLVYKGRQLDGPMLTQNSLKSHFQTDIVLTQVCIELFSSQYFSDLLKLVVVVSSFEKRFPIENLNKVR